MRESDDNTLLRQYAENNSEEAFAALVERHVNKVYSVAWRHTHNASQAEEITQAVFIILAKKCRSLGRGVLLAGWLCRTARLSAVTLLRSDIRRSLREREAQMQTSLETPESDPWPQIAPHLDAAMARLSARDYHAVVLRFFDGKSIKEVAAALGSSEDAAKMRLTRAVEKLRLSLNKRGLALPAAAIIAAASAHSIEAAPAVLTGSITRLAVAGGSAGSVSTLTLVARALQAMAWAKAKTMATVTAVILLGAGITTETIRIVWAAHIAAYPNIQGAWEGVMHLNEAGVLEGQSTSTRLVLKLTKTGRGYTATTDWLEKGRRDVRMGKVLYRYPSLQIELTPRDKWNLTIKPGATEMVLDHALHFIIPDPVVLKRTDKPSQAAAPLKPADFAPRPESDLQGYWTGFVETEPEPLPVNFRIAELPDGSFRAEGDNPMQGANGQPVTVTYNSPTVNLALATGAGAFEGSLNRGSTEIRGAWTQEGQATPASLRRIRYQPEDAQRKSRDYSFSLPEDLQGHWKGSWILPFANVKVTMRLALDIAKMPDGTFQAELTNVDEFGNDDPIPASAFQYKPPNLHLEWIWAGGAFEGKLRNGKLIGTWSQGGGGFPLTFERNGIN